MRARVLTVGGFVRSFDLTDDEPTEPFTRESIPPTERSARTHDTLPEFEAPCCGNGGEK